MLSDISGSRIAAGGGEDFMGRGDVTSSPTVVVDGGKGIDILSYACVRLKLTSL